MSARKSLVLGVALALGAETIPPNGSLTYTASWKPTQKGNLIATGTLVSLSHRAEAKLAIMVP